MNQKMRTDFVSKIELWGLARRPSLGAAARRQCLRLRPVATPLPAAVFSSSTLPYCHRLRPHSGHSCAIHACIKQQPWLMVRRGGRRSRR